MNTKRMKFYDPRFDTAANVLFNRQLEHIETRAYEVKHLKTRALEFVNVLDELDPTDMQSTFRGYDATGEAKLVATPTDDVPVVNEFGEEVTAYLKSYALGFEYYLDELRATARYGRPLDTSRADRCRRQLAKKLDDILSIGDSAAGLKGITNLANTLVYTIQNDGTGASKTFASKTADLIIRDVNAIIDYAENQTNDIEKPNRIVFPSPVYRLMSHMPRASGTDTTVLKFLEDNNTGIKFDSWDRLNDVGSGSTGRIMCYNDAVENVRALLPVAFEQLEPERLGMGWKIVQRFKTGGVTSPYPKAMTYADGSM